MSAPTRRRFGAGLIGLTSKSESNITGGFVFEGADQGLDQGHRVRDHARMQSPARRERVPVVIVGGGMAGLSAGWRMTKRGFHDFVILESEPRAGGNSRWGENEITPYPWAAHYLPVPDKRQTLTHELCADLGLWKDGVWNDRWLCHAPQERLFLHGRWQEGIEPVVGMNRADAAHYKHFEERIHELRQSGAFRIPMEAGLAKATPAIRALDQITLDDWLRREGLFSPYLHWLLDYSTRDDYGTRSSAVSAWVGLHYFAAREPEEKGPLTWPEGNGWIARRLIEKLKPQIRTRSMAVHIRREAARWQVFTEKTLYEADAVIFAAPTWLAHWLVEPAPPRWMIQSAPWITANLTLDGWPKNEGFDYAWDNVIYDSPSLGYVVATHQNVKMHEPRTVWTWYMALADGAAADQRRVLLSSDWNYWKEYVLKDLERAHPDIRRLTRRIDMFRIGHAMPRPLPGTVFNAERERRARPAGTFVYANCDLGGLSLFEEAQWRGVAAADHVLAHVGR
jgi:glycine/D-amino acid oxidase-like deaminating enzyme